MAKSIVTVRHGATTWAEAGRHTGRTDIPLTTQGERDARSVAAVLASWDFARVFASPLLRARSTAELAGYTPELDDDLMEWDYGKEEGRTNDEITAERPGWSKWFDHVDGGEQLADVVERVDRFLLRIADTDDDVVVFAHGHLLSILVVRWLELDPAEGRRFPLETATVSVLARKRGEPVIATLNRPCGQRRDEA